MCWNLCLVDMNSPIALFLTKEGDGLKKFLLTLVALSEDKIKRSAVLSEPKIGR